MMPDAGEHRTGETRTLTVEIGPILHEALAAAGPMEDVDEALQGLGTPTDIEQYATDWFEGQWADIIERSKIGETEKERERASATLALRSARSNEFKQAFDRRVRELQRLDTGLSQEKLLERARNETWENGIRTYDVGGETRKINMWTALPSEIRAAEIASTPAGTISNLETYAVTKRIVGEPGDRRREETILEEATRRFDR